MYPLISAERQYFKNAKLELITFPRLYWQVFGEQQDFIIETKKNGTITKYRLKPIDILEDYEYKRNDIPFGKRELQFINQTAYLIPGDLSIHPL
jgi:lantibiotic modifying enzyme